MDVNFESKLDQLFDIFYQEGVLDNVVLIGSWCMYFYQEIFNGYYPSIRTTDIDFYVPDIKKFQCKKDIVTSLYQAKYRHIQDILTNKSKFISSDSFEIEFLTKLNRNGLACLKLGNTGVYAESISYVDIFSNGYIEIKKNNYVIRIASPTSFILQKLIINDIRQGKAQKDISAIKDVLIFVKSSNRYNADLHDTLLKLPKKWQKKIRINALKNNIDL